MNRFLSNLPIMLFIVVAFAAVSSANAEEALPSQDQALSRALENHPDIVAAKAKVSMANAELYGKRIQVSRQVIGLYGTLKKLDAQISASKATLNLSKEQFESAKQATSGLGQSSKNTLAAQVQMAEAQLVQSIGQREQAEKELRLLVGNASLVDGAKTPAKATVVTRQIPQGPIVEKMKIALEKPIKLDFTDVPLADTLAYLSDKTGVMFSIQKEALEEMGIGTDQPITLNTSEVPLHAALQAFQDTYSQLHFVLRDYGVLITGKEYMEKCGYAPVLEMGKESAATPKAH